MSELLSRIMIDPEICHGKPASRHLRYPVESMLEYFVAGDTFEEPENDGFAQMVRWHRQYHGLAIYILFPQLYDVLAN
jgi:hypothetical protein